MEPENEEISLRYILKYSTREGTDIFKLFDTAESQSQGMSVAQQESWQNEWHDNEYQRVMVEGPPCPKGP